ncbi:unnamed protein product, partial [Prunus brigantina]
GASYFIGVSSHGRDGFPHTPFVIQSAILSLTFRRRQSLFRDLAWVALHLGSITLILLFTILLDAFLNMFLEHSWAWHPANALIPDPMWLFSFFLAYCVRCRMFSLSCGCVKDYDFIVGFF